MLYLTMRVQRRRITKMYITSNIVTELKLCSEKQKVIVHILNGPLDSFETTPVEFR